MGHLHGGRIGIPVDRDHFNPAWSRRIGQLGMPVHVASIHEREAVACGCPADCLRVFEQALVHPGLSFAVVFGVSDSNWPLYDLEHGRQTIGYYPQDCSFVPEDRWQK